MNKLTFTLSFVPFVVNTQSRSEQAERGLPETELQIKKLEPDTVKCQYNQKKTNFVLK